MATGVELATAWVRLVPTVDGVQDEITKAVSKAPVDKAGAEAGKKYSKGFSGPMKAGLAAAAGLAIAGVVAVFNTGLEEIKFGEEISAQTDQLIKNTGAAFSTSWIEDYTLALSQVSGISEEDLQKAGNNVLKFGDVSKETYERSVDAINNLGAAGKDVEGSSVALGKALADPAKAAALLKRQGVLLNDEQKALITSFTDAGDKAGAQGVILDALEGTYGGMAEAAGGTTQGQINKLGNTFENLSAVVVTAVMPAISGILEGLTGFFNWVQENQFIIPVFAAVIGTILVAAFVAWTASIWAANVALLANPITWVILAIVALIAIVILLVLNWDTVVQFLTTVWNGFISWFRSVMDAFLGWWNGLWTAVWEWIVSVWNNIVAGITAYFNLLFSGLRAVGGAISSWWNGLWNGISSFFGGIWEGILSVIGGVRDAFGTVFTAIGDIVRGAFDGVVGVVRGVINGIISVVNGAIDGINAVAGTVGAAFGLSVHIGHLPMLAEGGTITGRGSVIVGENGPEILRLPKGAQVDPDITSADGSRARGAALEIHGDVYTTDVDEFFEYAERQQRIAVAMAGSLEVA